MDVAGVHLLFFARCVLFGKVLKTSDIEITSKILFHTPFIFGSSQSFLRRLPVSLLLRSVHQGYLSFSDFSEVYSSLNDAVFLKSKLNYKSGRFQQSMGQQNGASTAHPNITHPDSGSILDAALHHFHP